MNRKNLQRKIAYLEFVSDQLACELKYVDKLLRIVGFPNGLETVKSAAQEVMRRENEILEEFYREVEEESEMEREEDPSS